MFLAYQKSTVEVLNKSIHSHPDIKGNFLTKITVPAPYTGTGEHQGETVKQYRASLGHDIFVRRRGATFSNNIC